MVMFLQEIISHSDVNVLEIGSYQTVKHLACHFLKFRICDNY